MIFSTLLLNFCHSVQYPLGVYRLPEGCKKQEIEECSLKLSSYKDHHGIYTPLWGARIVNYSRSIGKGRELLHSRLLLVIDYKSTDLNA